MKTACKVFLIIGIVVSGLLFISSFFEISSGNMYGILFLVYSLFAIIVNSFSLYKINYETSKNNLVAAAIMCLIGCNAIAGILMLCISDEDLKNNILDQNIEKDVSMDDNYIDKNNDSMNKLKQLKELKDNEIITKEGFDELKQKLLKKIN